MSVEMRNPVHNFMLYIGVAIVTYSNYGLEAAGFSIIGLFVLGAIMYTIKEDE